MLGKLEGPGVKALISYFVIYYCLFFMCTDESSEVYFILRLKFIDDR